MTALLAAQTGGLSVNSVSINLNPSGTDSFSLQGSFSGFTPGDSTFLTVSMGNFTTSVPVNSFTRSASGNAWTYQDPTGQAPGWLSSLVIDWTAQTVQAQAEGVVLAGLTNPFAVRLAGEHSSQCTMVRVSQATPGTYQLNPSDPVGMTCELASAPTATPKVALAGIATSVTVDLSPSALSNGTLQNVQLYQSDDNGQPVGAALCALKAQAKGDYSCTISINQAAAGTIPLIIEATVGGHPVLSPGFAVQVAEQATAADIQQLSAIENTAIQAWQNISQYGDNATARTATLGALRRLLAPPVELTATPFGLATDGLSIYVRTNAGVPVEIPLANAGEQVFAGATQQRGAAREARGTAPSPSIAPPPADPPDPGMPRKGDTEEGPVCPSSPRDIVWSDQVLVWAPATLWRFNKQDDIANVFGGSECPYFTGKIEQLDGKDATVGSLKTFTSYGTIIMETQGGQDDQGNYFVSGDTVCSPCSANQLAALAGNSAIACLNACYVAVFPNNANLPALTTSSILYAGFSYSMDGVTGFQSAFVPSGATNAYFGYHYSKNATDDDRYGVPLALLLVKQYKDAGDSYLKIKRIAPSMSFSVCSGSVNPVPANCIAETAAALAKNPYFQFSGDENVAYLGNPSLEMTELDPPQQGSQGLAAFMEGAGSCGPNGGTYLSLMWKNTVKAGHLYPLTGNANGEDSFTEQASDPAPADAQGTLVSDAGYAKYTPSAQLGGNTDNITTMFSPGPNAKPIAKACLTIGGNAGLFVDSYLDTTLDGANPQATNQVPTNFNPPRKVPPAFTAPLTDPAGNAGQGASASVSVAAVGNNAYTVTISVGGAAPGPMGKGPFEGLANVSLSAINPGVPGVARVLITGAWTPGSQAALSQCGSAPTCNFPDGVVLINDGGNQGILNGNPNIPLGNPGAAPFAVTADSSTDPVDIYVGLSDNAQLATASTFTLVLNIQFVNE